MEYFYNSNGTNGTNNLFDINNYQLAKWAKIEKAYTDLIEK